MSITAARPPAPTPPVDHGPRMTSFDPGDFGYPTGREEEWRFTPVADFASVLDGRAGSCLTADVGPCVRVMAVSDLERPWLPTDLPGALAHDRVSEAVVVDIPPDTIVPEPIRVPLRGTGDLAYGYVSVNIGSHTRATVVLEQDLERDSNVALVVDVAPGAQAQIVSIADGRPEHVHHLHWSTTVGRDAAFTGLALTLGGHRVRVVPTASFAGPGGTATLLGAFLASAGQYLEHRLFVEHDHPNCSSNVMYKGALEGSGTHSVWVGDVLVRRAGTGTDTYELNRNLLLEDGPRADSVPNLELETGNVNRAGHASATGRFDDEQLFYLRSRGLDERTARQLVVRGFFADVLSRIALPEADASALLQRIDERLGFVDTGAADE